MLASVPLLVLASSLPLWAQLHTENWGKGSSGVTLAAHEQPRQRTPQGTLLWYNLVGNGFPEGAVYNLWQWVPDQRSPQLIMEGVSFDKRGVLVCSGKPGHCSGDGPDDPINIKTTAVLGEMKRMAVASEDGKIVGFLDTVPFPIENSNKGCKLSVVRFSALADTVMARATGLQASAPLSVTTRYGSEGATTKADSGPDGSWTQVVLAQGTKQPIGKALISVSDGACNVAVTFDYGPGSNRPQ